MSHKKRQAKSTTAAARPQIPPALPAQTGKMEAKAVLGRQKNAGQKAHKGAR